MQKNSQIRFPFAFPAWLALLALLALPGTASAQKYERRNLVSDIAGVALRADSNLVNSWGVAFGPGGPVWINDNNAGVATLYLGNGIPFPVGSPLVVTIPLPAGGSGLAAPTGIVFNGTNGFVVSGNGASGPALFIFDTEDGTISGWSPAVSFTNAVLIVDNSGTSGPDGSKLGAVYKGLASAQDNSGATFIYAANFRDGVVEKYDSNFHFVGSFTDPSITPDGPNPGFAPFGIRNINGQLFVSFAMQNEVRHDDVAGPGSGFVDVFDTQGNLVRQFANGGTLNSPWGLTQAPADFGKFGGAILVGNFGDGRINAFDPASGMFLGQLHDQIDQPMTINGLWALVFGDGGPSGPKDSLLFTAGIGDEAHGLFGVIRAIK